MGMPNIDDRDLGLGVDDAERSTGPDSSRNRARDNEKGEIMKDPQECKPRCGKRRDEVRRNSDSGYSLILFLAVTSSTCSMESPL